MIRSRVAVWWIAGLSGAVACGSATSNGGSAAGEEDGSASTSESEADTSAPDLPGTAVAEMELIHQGETVVDGSVLEVEFGPQAAFMFAFDLQVENVLSARGLRLDLWADIPDYNLNSQDLFAHEYDIALDLEDDGSGTFEQEFVPLVFPDYTFPLTDLDGEEGVLHAVLKRGEESLVELEFEFEVSVTDFGTSDGDTGDDGGIDPGDGPEFVDATAEAGLDQIDNGPPILPPECFFDGGDSCDLDWSLGGATATDYDRDGDVDLFFVSTRGDNRLMRNDGQGHFDDVTGAAGLNGGMRTTGAAFADIDHDGDIDLYLQTIGEFRNHLFVNNGNGHFDEEAELRGADVSSIHAHAGTTPTFGDIDMDGYPDLVVSEWRAGFELPVGEDNSRLLMNRGNLGAGYFQDVTETSGVNFIGLPGEETGGPAGFGPVLADFDEDGLIDLFWSGDFGNTKMFWGSGDGAFFDGTATSDLDKMGCVFFGMGVGVGDFDADGFLDVAQADIRSDGFSPCTNHLYRNRGDRTFDDRAISLSMTPTGWHWGTVLFDYDNDGDLDMGMTNGWYKVTDYLDDRTRLYRQDDGTFADVALGSGLDHTGQGRAMLSLDYDLDGDLDVLIVHNDAPPILFRNDGGNDNGFLRVRVRGTASNTDGLGARVYVDAGNDLPVQMREIGVGAHFLGHEDRVAHFGLGPGDAPVAEVRVEWPASGFVQTFTDVPRDQVMMVVEAP